jgi:transposase-like protein
MPTLPQKTAVDKPAEIDWAAALQAEMRTVVRQAIEHLVGAELGAVLGPPYARGEARLGYRHGSKVRTITSPVGVVTLTIPRARLQAGTEAATEWQSQVLPASARRMRQVNEAVLQAYLCGANTRRIRGALKPLVQGRALSKSAISRIVQGLKAQLEAWRARTLADLDLVALYLDGFHLRVRLGGRVSPVPVLAVLGVQRSGQKVLVHLSLRGSESTAAWAAVCEDLAARGVRAPQLCIIDGGKGLRAAVERTWPAAAIQRCTVHKLRNLLTHAPRRLHDALRDDYHAIVFAEDGAAARRAYLAFIKQWTKGCPGAVTSLEEAGAELLTFFRYPRSQWKSWRTTNSIERLHLEFRRRVKTQGSFPTADAALALLYGLVASGQIVFRKLEGWPDMARALTIPAPTAEEAA